MHDPTQLKSIELSLFQRCDNLDLLSQSHNTSQLYILCTVADLGIFGGGDHEH